MAGENTTTTLDGLFKEIYAPRIERLVPVQNKFLKDIGFVGADKQEGNKYNQPVNLSQEHGVTYATQDAGAFALNSTIASQTKNAEVKGSQILIRGSLDYESAAKASKGGAASFVKATHYLITNLLESISKRAELSTIYGGSGIGITSGTANVDATHTVATITLASYATGIWTGMENAVVQLYNGAVLVGTVATVDSVNIANRTVTLSALAADITAIDAVGAGLDFYFESAFGNEMSGIDAIITNAATLFNISAATYSLWKGQSVPVGGAFTIAKMLNGLSDAQAFGLNEKVDLYVSPQTWNNMNVELAGNRRYDSSYKKEGSTGFEDIMYYSQNGGVSIKSHSYIKEGEAFCIPLPKWKRLGAQDISFNTPGRGGEIFRQLENSAGFEFRAYTNQAVFTECPARSIKFTGIVNT